MHAHFLTVERLHDMGFQRFGNEKVWNGHTGRPLTNKIFVGPVWPCLHHLTSSGTCLDIWLPHVLSNWTTLMRKACDMLFNTTHFSNKLQNPQRFTKYIQVLHWSWKCLKSLKSLKVLSALEAHGQWQSPVQIQGPSQSLRTWAATQTALFWVMWMSSEIYIWLYIVLYNYII